MEYIDTYLEALEIQDELIALNEVDLGAIIAKITPEAKGKALVKKLGSSVDKKDPTKSIKRIKSLLSFLPSVNIKSIDKYISSRVSDYKKLKMLASTIVKNSLPNISDKSADYASSFLALSSFVAKKGEKTTPKENLKVRVKEFVIRSRKFIDDHEEETTARKGSTLQKEDLPDLAVAWTIIVMATSLATSLGVGGYLILSQVATILPTFLYTAAALAFIVGVIGALRGNA